MDRKILLLLQCPFCDSPLRLKSVLKTYGGSRKIRFGVVRCHCDVFPIAEGILYLRKNEPPVLKNQLAVQLLNQKKYQQAVQILFEEKRRAKIPYALLWNGFLGAISFRRFLNVLAFFIPESGAWFRYLVNRNHHSTFLLALATLAYVKEKQIVIDVGCSVGWFMKYLFKQAKVEAIGLESSFSALYLARKYVLKNQGNLICADADFGLPFRQASVDRIFVNDVFMYLRRKANFLYEAEQIGKPQSLTFLTHVHNAKKENAGQGYGLTDQELRTYTRDYNLWGTADEDLFRSIALKTEHSYTARVIEKLLPLNKHSYSFVIAKGLKFKSQRSPARVEKLFNKTAINYREDPQLQQ